MMEHAPEFFLEGEWIDGLGHLVFADDEARRQHQLLLIFGQELVELGAGDLGEDDAVAVRKAQPPGEPAVGIAKLRVARQMINDGEHVLPRLRDGVGDGLAGTAGEFELGVAVVEAAKRGELPVFDLYDEEAARRMEDDEIRMLPGGAERNVVPAEIVVFEMGLQPLAETSFAGSDVLPRRFNGGDQFGHRI